MSTLGLADDLLLEADSPKPELIEPPSPIALSSRTPDAKPGSSPAAPTPPAGEPEGDEAAQGLFGDEEEKPQTPRSDRGRSSTATAETKRSRSPNPLEYEEEDATNVQEVWVNLALPQWPKLQPTDGKVWHMKLPAYVNIESRPYDPDYYRATLEDAPIDGKAEPLAARSRMIGVRNTIRWKWVTGPDGEPMRRSNSRMLRWSDGSVSLQLGSDLFDVAPSHGATLARPSDPEPETTRGPSSQPEAPTSNSSTTFICVAADTERVLITETAVAGQLSLVPTSMTSKTHLELAKHVGRQHVKHSRMKILDDMHDPAKMNELLLKASGVKPKARSSRTGERSRKKRAVSDESDGRVQAEQPRSKRIDEGEYDEDDGFVVADSDNEGENTDEAAYGATKKKGKKTKGKKRKGSEELDEMEEAERRIEERERERKRAKKGSSAGANGAGARKKKSGEYVDSEEDAEGEEEMEMDVESEDD